MCRLSYLRAPGKEIISFIDDKRMISWNIITNPYFGNKFAWFRLRELIHHAERLTLIIPSLCGRPEGNKQHCMEVPGDFLLLSLSTKRQLLYM